MAQLKVVPGGVTAPAGFLAAGAPAEIKKRHEGPGEPRKDMALIYSPTPCTAAATFTTNRVKAAPILVTREHLESGQGIQAVVVNSGNANACNGEQGLGDARKMAQLTASALGLDPRQVAVASTGVIGVPLPMDRIEAGIRALPARLSPTGGEAAARAIMTTDTVKKEIAVEFAIEGVTARVGAIAKGSGMIHPNMATMLAFITTDVNISTEALAAALRASVDQSYNMVTVDGDTSTNDMVLIMANGKARNKQIAAGTPEYQAFCQALDLANQSLAKMIARDGEGATRLIEVRVQGAPTPEDARKAAIAVARSNLVKAAVFGRDANWGRILCALGYSGAEFDPDRVSLNLAGLPVVRGGRGIPFDEDAAFEALGRDEVVVEVDLGSGGLAKAGGSAGRNGASATAWGCDLTYDYVKINGSYRT